MTEGMKLGRVGAAALYIAAIALCILTVLGIARYVADPTNYEVGLRTVFWAIPTLVGIVLLIAVGRRVSKQ